MHEGLCEVCRSELIVLFVYQDKEPRGIIPLENLSVKEVVFPRKPVRPEPCYKQEREAINDIISDG